MITLVECNDSSNVSYLVLSTNVLCGLETSSQLLGINLTHLLTTYLSEHKSALCLQDKTDFIHKQNGRRN